jgi:hypothetical protein
MTQLSPEGSRAVEDIAHRTKFTLAAETSMLFSIIGAGRLSESYHVGRRFIGLARVMNDERLENAMSPAGTSTRVTRLPN